MSSEKNQSTVIFIGAPCWGVDAPYYTVVYMAGLIKENGLNCLPFDMNYDFYLHVNDEDKVFWSPERNSIWIDASFCDSMFIKYEEWLTEYISIMLSNAPKECLVAFTVNNWNQFFTLKTSEIIKRQAPNVTILYGGVNCFPREVNLNFFELSSEVDIIYQGEAESRFIDYLNKYRVTGNVYHEIKGFAYRMVNENGKNEIRDFGVPDRPLLRDVSYTPAYDLLDISKYLRSTDNKVIVGSFLSRGCINRCLFCSESPNFGKYRVRRPVLVVKELKSVLESLRNKVPEFSTMVVKFADSNLTGDIDCLTELATLLIKEDLNIEWQGQVYINKSLDVDKLTKLRDSGLVALFWGIESGSQNVIDLMRKNYDITIARKIIKSCAELGMHQTIAIIVGFPGETLSDFIETIKLIFDLQRYCQINSPGVCLVRKGAPLYEQKEKYSIVDAGLYEWYTEGFTNNICTRVLRRFIANQAINNPTLEMENLIDTEELSQVSMRNDLLVRELREMLTALLKCGVGIKKENIRIFKESENILSKHKYNNKDREMFYFLFLELLKVMRSEVLKLFPSK